MENLNSSKINAELTPRIMGKNWAFAQLIVENYCSRYGLTFVASNDGGRNIVIKRDCKEMLSIYDGAHNNYLTIEG